MERTCFLLFLAILGANGASAATVQQTNSAPPPRRAAAPVARPAVMQQQRVGKPVQGAGPQRAGQPGIQGSGRSVAGAAGGAPPSPRSQLYDMVRPAPLAPRMAAPTAGVRSAARMPPVLKPVNVHHNPAHMVGNAGLQHNHSAFLFRRGDRAFHRRYYSVEGAWFWYDEPVPDGDPAFASAQDPNVPVCEDQSDECF
jgi:hypothetical protein